MLANHQLMFFVSLCYLNKKHEYIHIYIQSEAILVTGLGGLGLRC
jgi:uncharacterized protein YlbG (UPF0298 family)